MFAIVLFALVACASAAPHYNHHHHHNHQQYNMDDDLSLEHFMDRQVFDTRRFWDNLRRDMLGIETMLADLGRRFPSLISEEKIEGNEYKIRVPLPNYEEKDIAVKARKGLLIIQAVHKEDGATQRNYLDVRTLPDCVNEKGSWTFADNILVVTFPVNKNEDKPTVTEGPITQAPEHSREEMDKHPTNGDQDADVGAERGDRDLVTNEIAGQNQNTVEATTYAVDLKGEVELLPVNY